MTGLFKRHQEVKVVRGAFQNRKAKFLSMMEGFSNVCYVSLFDEQRKQYNQKPTPIPITQLEAIND